MSRFTISSPHGRSGFTLIEAMAATVLLLILFSLVITNVYRGQKTQLLKQAAQELVQNIRTVQNYAQGGRKAGICEGTYSVACSTVDNCASYEAFCGEVQYPDCVLPMECGEVPKGGYGIEIAGTGQYSFYADTHIHTDSTPEDGDYRWLTRVDDVGNPNDAAEGQPFQNVILPTDSVSILGIQINDTLANPQPICIPSNTQKVYITYEPPLGNGHIIRYSDPTYSQDEAIQTVSIWLAGDQTTRCRVVSVNGITGQVTEEITDCPVASAC